MARIRPGTMPVRLPGVAQVIQQVSPQRWTPNQIEVMQEAERIRKRQEAGESVDPRDIMAWAQLAQFVLKDDTLVGGLVNMLSRKSRESAAKERDERRAAMAREESAAQDMRDMQARGEWPMAVPNLQQQHDESIQELEARGIAPPPMPEAPVAQEQITETVAETPAPAQPAPDQPITRQQVYQDLLREESEQRKSELANIEKVVRERELTVSDLYGLAATAKSPEVVRTLMAMVPKVVEQDPAYAPRSLAELLFGGTDKTQQISKELISLWGQSQKARRGDDYTRRVERMTKAEERLRRLPSRVEEAQAGAGLKREKTTELKERRPTRIDLDKARAENLRAMAEWRRTLSTKEKRRWERWLKRKPKTQGLSAQAKDVVAAYAQWLDAVTSGKPAPAGPYSAFGVNDMARVHEKVTSVVVQPLIGQKRVHDDAVALIKNMEARAKKKAAGSAGAQTAEEKRLWDKINYWTKKYNSAKKSYDDLSLVGKEKKGADYVADMRKARDMINELEIKLGLDEREMFVPSTETTSTETTETGGTDASKMGWGP
jgi:hypothetical protein